jgi:hypothetical protein
LVWSEASFVCLTLAAQKMGRTGPIPTRAPPGGDRGLLCS